MMNPKDIRNRKIIEVLEGLKLPETVISELEEYLEGEKGEEVLDKLEFQDLLNAPAEEFNKLFSELLRKGRKEDIGKLFNILFAIGQSTCYNLIPMAIMTRNEGVSTCDSAKKAAVYAMMIGMGRNYMYTTQYIYGATIGNLISIAKKQPEVLKEALSYQRSQEENGKLVLLAAYFMTKYPADHEMKETGGLLSGIGKIIGIKNGDGQIDREDMPLMKEYEDILVNHLKNLYHKNVSIFLFSAMSGFAYLNFTKSKVLVHVVKVCLSANREKTLESIEHISQGLPMDICLKGGDLDSVFGIDSAYYISWAAAKGYLGILKAQLAKNQKVYLSVMEQSEAGVSNQMFSVIKANDKALYEKLAAEREQKGNSKEMEKMISVFVPKTPHAEVFKEYLRGEKEVSSIYPYEDEIAERYGGYHERRLLADYHANYKDFAFFRRCQVFMALRRSGYFLRDDLSEKNIYNAELAKKLFASFDEEKMDIAHQLKTLIMLYDSTYSNEGKQRIIEGATEMFTDYTRDRRKETLCAFKNADAFGRYFGLHVMRKNADENKQEILSYSQDSAKVVKEELLDILYAQKNWEEEVKEFLDSKKAAERELAIRVLLQWQGEETTYQELFIQALEKEKNAKVRGLLENALKLDGENSSGSRSITQEDLVKELHKGGKKRSLAWAYETPFSTVHTKEGEVASEEYLQAVLLCYASADGCGVSRNAATLAEALNQSEFAIYVNELFDKWMDAGAEAKKRWVLYAAAIHGGADIIQKLQHQIQEWPQNARGAIAAEAVQALALNPLPQALLIVDGISRKFKFKQVKAAAGKALEFAASQLGLTTEELADKIVPDLGFDENMERSFDYGERSFKVTITTALEIEVFDENGKKLKNLPAPGKKDDEVKAAEVYNEFKLMKKQMKATISSQKQRLEFALSTERAWTVEAWKNLFVRNPIMHQFAIGLIWGIYEDRKLVQSFRYMEDGSFNTGDEEEYELPENGKIGLVHPIELSAESKEAWKQQLEDYEITQPIEQLDRPVFYMTEEERGKKSLERFGGCILNDLSLGGKLQGMGWYRGSVEDGGAFYTYYREDAELSLGVELHFSGSFVGGENDDITVYDARFYKAGTIARGSYMYEKADQQKSYALKDIPARYFSEIVLQLTKATASSQEKDEDWKKEAH